LRIVGKIPAGINCLVFYYINLFYLQHPTGKKITVLRVGIGQQQGRRRRRR
jgi:hypothetical protein